MPMRSTNKVKKLIYLIQVHISIVSCLLSPCYSILVIASSHYPHFKFLYYAANAKPITVKSPERHFPLNCFYLWLASKHNSYLYDIGYEA